MLAWSVRTRLWRGPALGLTFLLGACAGVLGIEERQQDSADNYPEQGYDGCRPGVSCAGCLSVHQRECEVRSTCSTALTSADCTGCVCENCLEPVVDCQLDEGCGAIWTCIKQSRCDLSGAGAGSCREACADVIAAHGGAAGPAFQSATEIRSCAVASSCLNCLAPEPEPAAGCSIANACQDCPDCFRQCLCTGERFGNCLTYCKEDAPAATCTPENDCAGCANCFELCTCGGDGYEQCTSACQGGVTPPVGPCTLATGCTDCGGCLATCSCGGGSAAQCETQCAPAAPDDVCVDGSLSSGTCGGCQGCVAQCTCDGDALEDCMTDCSMFGCCDSQCPGRPMTACSCDATETADGCALENYSCDDAASCSKCACRSCPGKYALCQETTDCPSVFECMRSTQCHGSACRERCGSVGAGMSGVGEAYDVAEALWACDQANACACEDGPEPTLLCPGPDGDVACGNYQGTSALLPACCPSTAGTSGMGGSGASGNSCGLDLRRYFQNARECEPFAQGNRPRVLLEACPARTIFEPPYNGAKLTGCCNAAANSCGYYDDITGLGCLSAAMFGVAPQGCGLL